MSTENELGKESTMATQIQALTIAGNAAEGIVVPELAGEGHASLIVIRLKRGFLMCGYLSLEKAEQLGEVAVRVAGAGIDEVLANPITGITKKAQELGIADGMTGAEAAAILNR